ncbi:MAG TPA: hypothetical protein VL463_17415 [Kofleriaceae bacterium]|nr:hypothetical protein [Kofleriaceae bacterium]
MIQKRIAALAVIGLAFAATRAGAQPAGDKGDKGGAAATPSADDMEKAKKAFVEGKKLFDAKKYADAVDKFKESYRLSKNPLLLYNVGVTLDQKGDKDLALFYYKKFLSDAPADAVQRPEVTARVKELEKQPADANNPFGAGSDAGSGSASGSGSGSATTAIGTGSGSSSEVGAGSGSGSDTTPPPDDHPRVKHPKGTPYVAADFEHQVIDSAPPGKPLDLTAYAPEDAGWQVSLFYRGAGESKFTVKPMRPRYHELVARIPGKKMQGASIQYYIEVKDKDGGVVTRIGRASSPNLVYLEEDAKARFYPDMPDDDGSAAAALQEEHPEVEHPDEHHEDETPGGGLFDVGSRNFERAKWGTTYTAGGLVVVSLLFYWVASDAGSTIEGDAARSQSDCGSPPCSTYDADLKTIESRGRGFETMSNVALGIGVVSAAAAGYFWYEEYSHHGSEHAAAKHTSHDFVATPVIGDGFVGGAASLHF